MSSQAKKKKIQKAIRDVELAIASFAIKMLTDVPLISMAESIDMIMESMIEFLLASLRASQESKNPHGNRWGGAKASLLSDPANTLSIHTQWNPGKFLKRSFPPPSRSNRLLAVNKALEVAKLVGEMVEDGTWSDLSKC